MMFHPKQVLLIQDMYEFQTHRGFFFFNAKKKKKKMNDKRFSWKNGIKF